MIVGSSGHFPASLGASAASLGAFLAVIRVMLGTFSAACIAHVRADRTEGVGEFRASGHFAGTEGTDVRAAPIKGDALGHHLDVFLLKAGCGTCLTG